MQSNSVSRSIAVGGTNWRQAKARPLLDNTRVCEFDQCEIGRDAYPLYNHEGVIGVASVWLAFFIILAIQYFIAAGN